MDERLEAFRREMADALGALSGPLVFGEGPVEARVALVGEAPGETEAALGRPFVGKAGRNLTQMLCEAGLTREEMYVTNAVKFRPTRTSDAGRQVNRPPTKRESALFAPWLIKELGLVRPGLIVPLGNVPLSALLGEAEPIGKAHGRLRRCPAGLLFPMYHPASMIYNPALREVFRADLLALSALLNEGLDI